MRYIIYFFAAAFFLQSCTTTYEASRPSENLYKAQQTNYEEPPELIKESLFKDKDASLSEEDIQRILAGEIQLPSSLRIAVYRVPNRTFGRSAYWFSSEEQVQTRREVFDSLTLPIAGLENVQWVKPLPALLSPASLSLTKLRESAVRLQADVLLIVASQSELYYNDRLFKKDEAKSHATCELLLLDIRTGIIPFSVVETKEFFAQKAEDDLENDEFRKRVLRSALLRSVSVAADELKAYLRE